MRETPSRESYNSFIDRLRGIINNITGVGGEMTAYNQNTSEGRVLYKNAIEKAITDLISLEQSLNKCLMDAKDKNYLIGEIAKGKEFLSGLLK